MAIIGQDGAVMKRQNGAGVDPLWQNIFAVGSLLVCMMILGFALAGWWANW